MKMNTLAVLGWSVGAFLWNDHATAAYLGLSLESTDGFFSNHPDLTIRNAWNAGPVNQYDIYRLYANFDSNTAADRVNSVSGSPISPLTVSVGGGTFFNYYNDVIPQHYNLPGTSPVQRAWDTWVTLNGLPNGGSTNLAPGFDAETNNLGDNGSSFSSVVTAWFITPTDPQGQAVSNASGQADAPPGVFRVLLAQFTVTQGTQSITGNCVVNVNGVDFLNQTFFIPAPAGLVLLTLGVFAARRRRA